MKDLAIKKIDDELKAFKGSQYGGAVKKDVANVLKDFARQDEEFAQAIVQCDKTLSDCCAAITKGVGGSISDLEAYCRAVQFYFPGADIRFHMAIDLCAGVERDDPAPEEGTARGAMVLNLSDFL